MNPEDLTEQVAVLDPDVAAEQMIVTQLYALTMMQGLDNVVEQKFAGGDVQLTTYARSLESDSQLANGVRSAGNGGKTVVKLIANRHYRKALSRAGKLSFSLAKIKDANPASISKLAGHVRNGSGTQRALGVTFLAVTIAGFLDTAGLFGDSVEANASVTSLTLALTAYSSVVKPIQIAFNLADGATDVTRLSVLLGAADDIGQTAKAERSAQPLPLG